MFVVCQIWIKGVKSELIMITNQETQGNNFHKNACKQNLDFGMEFACIIPLHVS